MRTTILGHASGVPLATGVFIESFLADPLGEGAPWRRSEGYWLKGNVVRGAFAGIAKFLYVLLCHPNVFMSEQLLNAFEWNVGFV